jgi:hypothetical protein
MKYKSRSLTFLGVSVLALFGAMCPLAKGTYVATLNEVGTDVVGSGSGSIDLTDLTFVGGQTVGGAIAPASADLVLGAGLEFLFSGIAGPSSFGSGGVRFADSDSGNDVEVFGPGHEVGVPSGYVSGTSLGVSTATWNNQTFATLGVTPGTYVWTWGSGEHADSFTLQIGPTNGVPDSGSTFGLLLAGLSGLFGVSRLRSRQLA